MCRASRWRGWFRRIIRRGALVAWGLRDVVRLAATCGLRAAVRPAARRGVARWAGRAAGRRPSRCALPFGASFETTFDGPLRLAGRRAAERRVAGAARRLVPLVGAAALLLEVAGRAEVRRARGVVVRRAAGRRAVVLLARGAVVRRGVARRACTARRAPPVRDVVERR